MNRVDEGPPDEVLVVASILGDLEAFDELVRRYRPAAVRAARGIVSLEDADDVAQESLLLAFKALPALEEPAKFAAWLHAITRRCALRVKSRALTQRNRCVPLDEELLGKLPALSPPAAREEIEEELAQALSAIPRDYALALRLHFLDEMPLKRIAAFLGISLATVKWRIFRGKKLLSGQFKARKKEGNHGKG